MAVASDGTLSYTDHGLLVALGEFLQQHGLLNQLMQVPISQKTGTFTPQAKLIEFLASLFSGIEYLSDLNDAPHPLARDDLVARAWGLPGFAHCSGVSRTLSACDANTVAAVRQAIETFSQPFIRTAVHELTRRGRPIVYDLDLMGQPVSSTSTTYSAVGFGWMDDAVRLGYQLAGVCYSIARVLCSHLPRLTSNPLSTVIPSWRDRTNPGARLVSHLEKPVNGNTVWTRTYEQATVPIRSSCGYPRRHSRHDRGGDERI